MHGAFTLLSALAWCPPSPVCPYACAWQLFMLVEQDFANNGGRCRELELLGGKGYYMRHPADIGHIMRDTVAFPKWHEDWKRLDKCG